MSASKQAPAPGNARSYGSGARILSIGIASTGLLTFAYFSIASHVLSASSAKAIDLLWSVMFVIISVIYRPIEQLLSRTIAERRARGRTESTLRVPMLIQGGFALTFLILALIFKERAPATLFDHDEPLYWILVVGTLAYAASYFARGWLAGPSALRPLRRPRPDGVDIADRLRDRRRPWHRQRPDRRRPRDRRRPASSRWSSSPWPSRSSATADRATALDGPITVDEADAALAGPGTEGVQEAAAHEDLSLRRGACFAFWVSAIMLSEQALLNGAVLTVNATAQRCRTGRNRLQRPPDRASSAAALPGDPDLAAASPDRPRGDRRARGLRPRHPRDVLPSSPSRPPSPSASCSSGRS